jgi:hypothetical protein
VANKNSKSTPTIFTRMGSGTKRLMTNTKSLLTFQKPATAKSAKKTQTATRGAQEKPGFFHRMFYPEPPPPPKTVDEWMSLEQIHP